MTKDRTKNLITISFLASIASDRRLIAYLRHEKEQTGVEIKAQISKATQAYFDVYAVGEDPSSTEAEFEKAFSDCEIDLTSQLTRIRQYKKTHRYRSEDIVPEVQHEVIDDDEEDDDDEDDEDEYANETREQRLTRIKSLTNNPVVKI